MKSERINADNLTKEGTHFPNSINKRHGFSIKETAKSLFFPPFKVTMSKHLKKFAPGMSGLTES